MGRAAFDSITELSTCQHDLCRPTREYIFTSSLRDGLLFLYPFQALRAWLLSCSPCGTRKMPYREAVRDHSPGLPGLGFCQRELALKGRPNAMVFLRIARYAFSPVPVDRPFRADFDGAFPGLKAWAVLLNRFVVRSSAPKARQQKSLG